MRKLARALAGSGGVMVGTFHLGEPNRFAERWSGAAVAPNVFQLLRVSPMLGHDFSEHDVRPGAPPVVIVGATIWRGRSESDSGVIRRAIRLNGVLRTVVGVLRDGLRFPSEADLWVPQLPEASPPVNGAPSWLAFARLRVWR